MRKSNIKALIFLAVSLFAFNASAQRDVTLIDDDWQFAFGDASDPMKDFGCGTEYFTYMAKAASIHNEGPYSPKFDPEKWGKEWITVDLPHDWVVDLPFAPEASHSHGYKTVGYKYPETSVGWYRKVIFIPESDRGRSIELQFDGIFRDAQVWFNGFFLGREPSGYADQVYDVTPYVNFGGENVIAVRADASVEEGWFYEGAGIYRHVWLRKTNPVHIPYNGTFVSSSLSPSMKKADMTVRTKVANDTNEPQTAWLFHTLLDAKGDTIDAAWQMIYGIGAHDVSEGVVTFHIQNPHLWDLDDPHLYTLETEVLMDGLPIDSYTTRTGIRSAEFDPNKGFLLNGKPVKLKGVNMHQDHAGVGAAIPDALNVYRLKELKKYGVNAYRSSHNPASPAVLDACDSLGILVIDENRLTGVNEYHKRLLQRMIERDRNHPSVILYSVGNEEWGIEWNDYGTRIVEIMRDYCHQADSTRLMTVASSSGPTVLVPADVAGYNYIMQNPVDEHRHNYPQRCALGSEETSGCGSRGIYFDDVENGRMAAINRSKNGSDSVYNCIERGWKFYDSRPWLGGLFYWTGFDYRGEPNPLQYPATGSEFGILDYCGFPKDEAYYLKSWWTDEPVLHILPHWNLSGHKGEKVSVWTYSNCDEVELIVNGRNLGRKIMPRNGHLEWEAVYKPGTVKAIGYKKGVKVLERVVETTGSPANILLSADRRDIAADNRDLAVCTVALTDRDGRFVPDGCETINITVDGPVRILGVGNGDPAFRASEHPTDPDARTFEVDTFNGLAQILIQSTGTPGIATVTVTPADGSLTSDHVTIRCK